MTEFSRRVDVRIIKDEPKTFDEFFQKWPKPESVPGIAKLRDEVYENYLKHFQPYRWSAVAANNEIVASGERYLNLVGVMNAIELNYGDDTTAYMVQMFGEDRGEKLLRYGKTDLNQIQGMSKDG